jgi:putative methyltransferase (TIGR04325 family)
MKQSIRYVTPPILSDAARLVIDAILRKRDSEEVNLNEWEYAPNGWESQKTDANIKGWNVQSVVQTYKNGWQAFVGNLDKTIPFSTSPGFPTQIDCASEKSMLSYAYALSFSTRNKTQISMLDWGGGVGHFYEVSRALLPELQIEYHCKDVPIFVDYGRDLLPQVHFYVDETCLGRKYDFVLASSSLQYAEDWSLTLQKLAQSTAGHIFVTDMPFILHSPSFVFVQRPYRYGYETEYLGWCLNRQEFLEHAEDAGLKLVREFIIGHRPYIHMAPEQNEYRGYLFRSPKAEK